MRPAGPMAMPRGLARPVAITSTAAAALLDANSSTKAATRIDARFISPPRSVEMHESGKEPGDQVLHVIDRPLHVSGPTQGGVRARTFIDDPYPLVEEEVRALGRRL